MGTDRKIKNIDQPWKSKLKLFQKTHFRDYEGPGVDPQLQVWGAGTDEIKKIKLHSKLIGFKALFFGPGFRISARE